MKPAREEERGEEKRRGEKIYSLGMLEIEQSRLRLKLILWKLYHRRAEAETSGFDW